jgi:hypothetical protein
MAFGVAIQLNIALSVGSCAQGVYNIYRYISKYETACRYSIFYALRYALDLCALYIRRRLWRAASLTFVRGHCLGPTAGIQIKDNPDPS